MLEKRARAGGLTTRRIARTPCIHNTTKDDDGFPRLGKRTHLSAVAAGLVCKAGAYSIYSRYMAALAKEGVDIGGRKGGLLS